MLSITGVDKVELLRKLWEKKKPAVFFAYHPHVPVPTFDDDLARKAVTGYIDYFQGRCIKTDLSQDEADPRVYDRDEGEGAFKRVLANL